MKKLLFIASSAPEKLNPVYEAFCEVKDLKVDIIYRTLRKTTYYDDERTFIEKVFEKIGMPMDKYYQNTRIIEYCIEHKPDYIFVVKGNQIKPSTLNKIKITSPLTKLISWSADDMYAAHNRSLYYKWGVKYFDLVVTLKSYNCNSDELPSLGAKRILFQGQSFLPRIHKPCLDCGRVTTKHDVIFIGSAEKDRFEKMNYVAENGIEVNIYGAGWDQKYYQQRLHPNVKIHFKELFDEEYSKSISCSKISLGFLRKQNRDLQTQRTFEIPACQGFMLAERTEEQLAFFEEGVEAEYFDNSEELLKKIKYFLSNENEREEIAIAGRKRCIDSGYSYQDRVNEIMAYFNYE